MSDYQGGCKHWFTLLADVPLMCGQIGIGIVLTHTQTRVRHFSGAVKKSNAPDWT